MDKINYKGYSIQIDQDTDAENPREWDNLGTFAFFHSRYELGDKNIPFHSDDFNSWAEVEEHIRKELKAVICLPVYMYDHGGLRFKVGSFQGLLPQGHAEFDSGQVGFIYITAEKIRKEYSVKRITKKLLARVAGYLEGEIKTLDQWSAGDVYYYYIERNGKHVDSCHGFFGYDEAEKEAKAVVDGNIALRHEQHLKQTKAYVKNRVPLNKRLALEAE